MTSQSDEVPQVAGDEANGSKTSAPKQRSNKPISAKRRMQNCKAQRAYRQRKRDKLRELEARVASLVPGVEAELASTSTSALAPIAPLETPNPNSLRIDSLPSPMGHIPSTAIDSSHLYNPVSWRSYDPNMWLDDLPSTSLGMEMSPLPHISPQADQTMTPENDATESFSALLHDSNRNAFSNIQTQDASISTTAELSGATAFPASSSSLLSLNTPASMYTSPKSESSKDVQIYRPSSKSLFTKPLLIRRWFESLPKSTRDTLTQLAKDGDFSFVDIISSLLMAERSASNSQGRISDSSDSEKMRSHWSDMRLAMSPAASYSPYRNSLRISRISYFAAFFSNYSSLGFDFALFLDERSISPFCTGHQTEGDSASTITREEDIPLGLRPIPSQYTVRHHPYIDSLPFPTFRKRALAALAADPPLLDEDDLCIDLMLRDGLVCWGSSNKHGMDQGTPWDVRSWEAQEWFLKKWKWLVGGQEGELWQSSRWWAAQRGETLSMHS